MREIHKAFSKELQDETHILKLSKSFILKAFVSKE